MAEQRDLSIRAIAVFGVALVLVIALVLLVAGGLTKFWQKGHPAQKPSALPPEPRLQVHAPADLQHWRATENALLNNYAWADRSNGIVRIPINRAMELISQRGLPK